MIKFITVKTKYYKIILHTVEVNDLRKIEIAAWLVKTATSFMIITLLHVETCQTGLSCFFYV